MARRAPSQHNRTPHAHADGTRPKPYDGGAPHLRKVRRDPHRRITALVAVPLAMTTLVFGILLVYNHVLSGGAVFQAAPAIADEGVSGQPAALQADLGDPAQTTVSYISEIAEGNDADNELGIVSTNLTFDDAWFEEDPTVYNHELARACAVLAAVVNSESAYYGGRTDIDFVAEALEALGFTDIRTDSYAERSVASDEVAAIFTGSTDVTAYVLARKTLADGRDLVFVGIRGTFGSEWLSNFNFQNSSDDGDANEHLGFTRAEGEIAEALAAYCSELGVDTDEAALLVTGHSRGGAVANLLAARFDGNALTDAQAVDDEGDGDAQAAGQAGFAPEHVYAYTFAAPNTTQAADADGERYANIFNVVNATDLVPRLPLAVWGWGRYGVTVSLPAPGSDGFADAYEDMQLRRAEITGFYDVKSPFAEADGNLLDEVEENLAHSVADLSTFLSVDGISNLFSALGSLDVGQLVASHYPDTYLSWLQTLEPGRLAFG